MCCWPCTYRGGATIGAGAIVVKDVPENSTCVGNPGRIVNNDSYGKYIKNKWEA